MFVYILLFNETAIVTEKERNILFLFLKIKYYLFQHKMENNKQLIVPEPTQRDKGIHFIFLNESNDCGIKDDGLIIAIGNLGSFIYNKEKALLFKQQSEPSLPSPQLTPMKCKDADFVRGLTRDECQLAMINWASRKCCIRKQPAEHMHINSVTTYNAFSYVLNTFTEKRSLVLKYKSCKMGEQLDTNDQSMLCDPALIQCNPNEMFHNHVKYEYVPKSETLQTCFRCIAFGYLKCSDCNGMGNRICNKCNGGGETKGEEGDSKLICDLCNGKRILECRQCCSKGEIVCKKCNGSQWLIWYLQVKFE